MTQFLNGHTYSEYPQNEKFEDPAGNHNITGQYDPAVHSATGRVPVTRSGFPHSQIDNLAIQASEQLGRDFQYNINMNYGTPLGLGLSFHPIRSGVCDGTHLLTGWLQSTIGHDGTRSSAATTYLDDDTRSPKNLHIVTNTRVTRVLSTADTENLTIRTVEVRNSDTSSPLNITASKEVILSCGTIGSPLILMHSGIANAQELEDLGIKPLLDNPSVGRNLTDHPFFFVSFNAASNSLDFGAWGK